VACAGSPATPESTTTSIGAVTHPGSIRFVDLDAKTEDDRLADRVPETIAWGEVDGARVPVVRIESRVRGGGREVTRYGPDGAVIDVTTRRATGR